MNRLLVIIISYNSMKWAKRCYDSLRASTVECDVITIDNKSTDGTLEYIRENYPEVKVVENNSNLGFGQANNIGLQKAIDEGYDFVYLLNQDAWVMPDTFEKLIALSNSHPEYGILSPMQIKADMNRLDEVFKKQLYKDTSSSNSFIEDLYFGHLQDIYDVEFVMAAHWFITRKCLKTVGGFSPTFYHYGEDNNYLNRVLYYKLKVGIVTTTQAIHDRNAHSQEKNRFLTSYISYLRKTSNPLWKESVLRYVAKNIIFGTFLLDKQPLIYGFKLLYMYNKIERNYKISITQRCAFLHQ